MRRKRSSGDACDIDMTPMIDVVFQMIIFFIVTMKMDENINEDIKLEFARQAEAYKGEDPRTMVIEVDRRGWFSISNCQIKEARLGQLIKRRYQKLGTFPVMIRADKNTQHKDVRKIMDMCSAAGIWRIDFAAIKEPK